LLKQNIDALTIHGRTVKELSKVPAHWEEIGKAVTLRDDLAPSTAIIGNGDIASREQAQQAHTTHGVDGVMIGKGVFHNPWVFEKIPKKHTSIESLQLLLKHTKLYCDTYPNTQRFVAMKKYFKIYVRSFRGANALIKQLMETRNISEVEKLVKPYI
jgi:tRNA-dihydrouridine synthase